MTHANPNSVAALKCRQRKKQWLSNLQNKVDIYTQENDALQQCCAQLREQVQGLKSALMAHRNCPVSLAMGASPQQIDAYLSLEVSLPFMLPNTQPPNGAIPNMPMMGPNNSQSMAPR